MADTYEFVHRTLTGDGTVTAEITSLAGVTADQRRPTSRIASASHPGLASWAKAGLLLTPSTTQGSAYAAVMATGGHGIHFQYNYTHDTPGAADPVTTSTPRWLRLVRAGDTITGYDSTNGQRWTQVGSARPAGTAGHGPGRALRHLAAHVPGATPGTRPSATATFDHLNVERQPSLELVARARHRQPVADLLLPDARDR